jgi:hypothetical protein
LGAKRKIHASALTKPGVMKAPKISANSSFFAGRLELARSHAMGRASTSPIAGHTTARITEFVMATMYRLRPKVAAKFAHGVARASSASGRTLANAM